MTVRSQGVEAAEVHPAVRVCAVLWRAHDLIVSGKRRRIAAAVADAGFALCGPSSPELWRPGCDEALFAALGEWQRMAFGWGVPPLLAVFDEAKTPEERADLVLLAGRIAGWGVPVDLGSIAPIVHEVEAAVEGAFAVPNGEEGFAEALREGIYRALAAPESALMERGRVPEPSDPIAPGRRASDALAIVDEASETECICGVWRAPDHPCPKHGKLYPSEPVPLASVLSDVLAKVRASVERREAIEQHRRETSRRIAAVHVAFDASMPPWVLARILDGAPADAELAGIDQRWASGELVVALRSKTFPVVPEGVEAPRVVAKVFDSTKQVQIEWPHRGMEPDVPAAALWPVERCRAKKPGEPGVECDLPAIGAAHDIGRRGARLHRAFNGDPWAVGPEGWAVDAAASSIAREEDKHLIVPDEASGVSDAAIVAAVEREHGPGSIPAMIARSEARAKKPWCACVTFVDGEEHAPGCPSQIRLDAEGAFPLRPWCSICETHHEPIDPHATL